LAKVHKIKIESLGTFTSAEKAQTSLRLNPNVLKLIKKKAYQEHLSIEKMIERMAIYYINEV